MASTGKRGYASSTPEQSTKVMKTDVIEADDFDVESENPFSAPSCGSDVAFVVEDKNLHVHKSVVSVSSPVFRAMFTSNFSEKDANEVKLPTKKYDAVLNFLLHLYPVYSLKDIANDTVLAGVLPLAHEYQAKHVLLKCSAYIKTENSKLSAYNQNKRMLLFLYLCEKYNVTEPFNDVVQKNSVVTNRRLREKRIFQNAFKIHSDASSEGNMSEG